MDEKQRLHLVHKARNPNNLSQNDIHELKKLMSVNLQPFAGDLSRFMDRAHGDDDAVILKSAIRGESSLSSNERHRLNEAVTKRGRRRL